MIDLESRLADLGDTLDLDESDDLAEIVLAAVAAPPHVLAADDPRLHRARPRATWIRAAAVASVSAVALLAIPASRQAIAGWLGLDGVVIDRQPELSVPAAAPVVASDPPAGGGVVVEVDGTAVLVDEIDLSEFRGRLDEALISKTLAVGTGIERVDVAGKPGLWIDGDPHVVSYRASDGAIVEERAAGNTLLWQDGDVIRRVEGFPNRDAALAYAATVD